MPRTMPPSSWSTTGKWAGKAKPRRVASFTHRLILPACLPVCLCWVDGRYQSDRSLIPLLPQWISCQIAVSPGGAGQDFGKAFGALTRFFRSRATSTN